MSFRIKHIAFFEKHYKLDDLLFHIGIWKLFSSLGSLRGYIKYHPNRLHIKTLGRGWVDRDHQLLHACMQILVDFVEQEKRHDMVDWEWEPKHLFAAKEMERLYDWWKHDPFAQDATVMPEGLKNELAPLVEIEDWAKDLYLGNKKNMQWIKNIIRKCKNEAKKDEKLFGQHLYYHCLNLIEIEAVSRQDQALKDLINIRNYMWT